MWCKTRSGLAVIGCFTLGALLLLGPAWAEDPLAEMRRGAASLKTLQARFVQHKQLRILKKPLVSTGQFAFKAPGSVRWEYQTPLRTLSIIHDGKVQRFIKSSDGVWAADSAGSAPAMRVVLEQITGWMAGRFVEDEAFEARAGDPKERLLILTPRSQELARFIQRVEIRFSSQPGVVQSVRIVEGKDASTLITFEDVKVNGPLPARLFEGPQ